MRPFRHTPLLEHGAPMDTRLRVVFVFVWFLEVRGRILAWLHPYIQHKKDYENEQWR